MADTLLPVDKDIPPEDLFDVASEDFGPRVHLYAVHGLSDEEGIVYTEDITPGWWFARITTPD